MRNISPSNRKPSAAGSGFRTEDLWLRADLRTHCAIRATLLGPLITQWRQAPAAFVLDTDEQ